MIERQSEEEDPDGRSYIDHGPTSEVVDPKLMTDLVIIIAPDSSQKEIFSSWALFILIMLLIAALFTSYLLQIKKVEAIHETSISIFAGKLD